MGQIRDHGVETLRRAVPARRASPTSAPAHLTTLVVAVAVDVCVIVATTLLALPAPIVVAVAVATVLLVALTTQRSLRSALAGLMLLLARPYAAGERLRLFLPAAGRPVDAELVRVGLVNTTLATSDGLFVVPNALLLRHPPQCRG